MRKAIPAVLIVVLLGGGAWFYLTRVHHTPIDSILKNPRSFDGKTINIEGSVIDRTNLLFVKMYALKDSSGEIMVVTDRILPQVGEKVRVRGQVKEAFAVGEDRMLVFMEVPVREP